MSSKRKSASSDSTDHQIKKPNLNHSKQSSNESKHFDAVIFYEDLQAIYSSAHKSVDSEITCLNLNSRSLVFQKITTIPKILDIHETFEDWRDKCPNLKVC